MFCWNYLVWVRTPNGMDRTLLLETRISARKSFYLPARGTPKSSILLQIMEMKPPSVAWVPWPAAADRERANLHEGSHSTAAQVYINGLHGDS